jgi:hypothetical protein
MTKLVQKLGLAILAAVAFTGCSLYFGEDDSDEAWGYCGDDGYYTCEGDDCSWAGAECPAGGGGGFACDEANGNNDCAPGCYCQDGVCEEAGFCDDDADCPAGFHCEVERASCVPNECDENTPCDSGSVCNNGQCEETCVCTSDRDAQTQGFGYCDEATSTCMVGTDPAGSCGGPVTGAAPECPEGEVPLILNGAYTGACRAIAQCDVAPGCPALQHESDCLADGVCAAIYNGINCRKPDGTACQAGDTGCVCESFEFRVCADGTGGNAKVVPTLGGMMALEALIQQQLQK